LISPPKLTGEQIAIFNALTNSKGSALTLKYPKTGEFLSAFVFPDGEFTNSAESNRVMVFYQLSGSTQSTEPTVFLTFLEKRNNRWKCTYDIAFFATDIEKVELAKLGDCDNLDNCENCSQDNIIISYSILNQPDKSLCVIAFDNDDVPRQVYGRDFCVYYEIGDFADLGNNMLMSINRSGEDTSQSTVNFSNCSDGQFMTSYAVRANPNANEYVMSIKSNIVTETLDENEKTIQHHKPAMFLEYSQTDTLFNTGIIVWNVIEFDEFDNQLEIPDVLPRNLVYSRNQVRRREHLMLLDKRPNQFTAHAYARDIDGDGTVNAAGNRSFPGYDHDLIPGTERVRAAVWYTITANDEFEQLYYTYLNINNDYVFFFPEEWEYDVTVTVDNETDEVVFWEYSREYENVFDVKNKLLAIVSNPKGERVEKDNFDDFDNNYVLYDSNEQFDYYVRIYDDSIETDELEERLKIFEVV